MQYRYSTPISISTIALTTLLATLTSTQPTYTSTGTGTAAIINNCGRPVHYQIAFNGWSSPPAILSPGQTYTESYRSASNPAGVSIKLNFDPQRPDYIAQLEYTVDNSKSQWNPFPSIFYDISLVNGAPFEAYGMTLVPSDGACRKSVCPAGQPCPRDQAYSVWNDDLSSKKCGLGADLTLTLCTGAKPPATGPVLDGGVAHLGPVWERSVEERAPEAGAAPVAVAVADATSEAVVERNASAESEPEAQAESAIAVGHAHGKRHQHQRRHRLVRPFSA